MNAENTLQIPHGDIMVVEDNTSDVKFLTEILKKAGYRVRPAGDGELALRSVRAKLPDLILLDINLPGMKGVEVCRHLKTDPGTRDVPIIFISALGETDLKVKALEAGGTDYVTKPVDPSEVLARISTHLKLYRLHQELAVRSEELAAEIEERKRAEEEKKKLEFQLRQSQKMESIGTLAGGVAHEINNPINGIMNYAQLIADTIGENQPVTELTVEIIHETERIAGIVHNLLIFARDGKKSHSPARMVDIVNSVLSLVQTVIRKDQIAIEIDVSEDLPKIKCRSQQIQQVIMNLMINARDALNERYPKYEEHKIVKVSSFLFKKEGCDWLRTTVEDHGIGMDTEIQKRIFDPFFTTKPNRTGTGLGLSISYGIVKEHGGEMHVESEPGQYTRFYLDFPVYNDWELS